MAVKKHDLGETSIQQPDLATLVAYLSIIHQQYLPPRQELLKNCSDIVNCISRAAASDEKVQELIALVETYLEKVLSSTDHTVRQEIVCTILADFYKLISDPKTEASQATSVLLVVLGNEDSDGMLAAAHWVIQQDDTGPEGIGLKAALGCLYNWIYGWNYQRSLGAFVLAFLKALQENERYDILVEVTLQNLCRMFLALGDQQTVREASEVICHVLSSVRTSIDALDRITPIVGPVLTALADSDSLWKRQLMQDVVLIANAMIETHCSKLKDKDLSIFRCQYSILISCLERHMTSHDSAYLLLTPWPVPGDDDDAIKVPVRKVGLVNLGNTCYINSVVQALLITRHFSNHTVMRMTAVPYWAKMAVLFAKMMHSISRTVNPEEFYKVMRPPFFTTNQQHDSSEFLGYLFELLQSYEHRSDHNFDYSRPPVLLSYGRGRALSQASNGSSDNEHGESSSQRRSGSPRPGSSAAGNNAPNTRVRANVHKRTNIDRAPANKRFRNSVSSTLRPDSFIDRMFGGVLLTRVECTECHSYSLSRDVFRDLQLAFPEMPETWQYSVQSLVEYYCSRENMTGDNQYDCPDCGCLRDAVRSVLVETTPKFLILVLKNFKSQPSVKPKQSRCYQKRTRASAPSASKPKKGASTRCRGKKSAPASSVAKGKETAPAPARAKRQKAASVPAPARVLTRRRACAPPAPRRFEPKQQVQTKLMNSMYYDHHIYLPTRRVLADHASYTLYATVIHSGTTLDSGHYYTISREDEKWRVHNDLIVTEAKSSLLSGLGRSHTPYILFYRRMDLDEIRPPALEDLPPVLQESVMAHDKEYEESVRTMRSGRP